MHVTSERHLDDGVLERRFTLGDVPGILWTPSSAHGGAPAPLILQGHPGGLDRMYPRLAARALHCAAAGFASATLELPGSGERPRSAEAEAARADLQQALRAGRRVPDDVVDRLVLPLVDAAVPELQAALDALLPLPELADAAGCAGGVISVGVRLARVEPRIRAALLFAGSRIPRSMIEEARQVSVPALVLLQWDDEGNDRQQGLDLFDALGSTEKSLHANLGGHTGVPAWEADSSNRFFERHLGPPAGTV